MINIFEATETWTNLFRKTCFSSNFFRRLPTKNKNKQKCYKSLSSSKKCQVLFELTLCWRNTHILNETSLKQSPFPLFFTRRYLKTLGLWSKPNEGCHPVHLIFRKSSWLRDCVENSTETIYEGNHMLLQKPTITSQLKLLELKRNVD